MEGDLVSEVSFGEADQPFQPINLFRPKSFDLSGAPIFVLAIFTPLQRQRDQRFDFLSLVFANVPWPTGCHFLGAIHLAHFVSGFSGCTCCRG